GQMILCDSEIKAAIRSGLVIIDSPPDEEHYTTSAVDMTVGDEFFRWKGIRGGKAGMIIDPGHPDHDYTQIASQYQVRAPPDANGAVVLEPGGFLLALTQQRIELPIGSRLAARVEGRSTLARYGIGIHVTAPTIHSGFRGRITLEVTNQGGYAVRLRPGMRIC